MRETGSAVSSIEEEIARAVRSLSLPTVRATYREQNEFMVLERWLPAALIETCAAEALRLRSAIHRNYIPRHKKGGSVSAFTLATQGPTITALYRSPALLDFLRAVTGQP